MRGINVFCSATVQLVKSVMNCMHDSKKDFCRLSGQLSSHSGLLRFISGSESMSVVICSSLLHVCPSGRCRPGLMCWVSSLLLVWICVRCFLMCIGQSCHHTTAKAGWKNDVCLTTRWIKTFIYTWLWGGNLCHECVIFKKNKKLKLVTYKSVFYLKNYNTSLHHLEK